MRTLRFNIASILAIILVLGVSFAALRESSEVWASGIFSATLGCLLISILLAVHRTEFRRAFWIGFAVFGGIYLGLSLVPSIESKLITTKALDYLASEAQVRKLKIAKVRHSETSSWSLSDKLEGIVLGSDENPIAPLSRGQVGIWDAATGRLIGAANVPTENIVRIGHALFALLLGWVGGRLSGRLWRASRHTEVSPAGEARGSVP
jgi:hypothetical protein